MVAGILLAAGKSARMKEPKPLLQWQGKTLLEYQIQQLARLPVDEIIVVLGHEADAILKTVSVNDRRVKFIRCESYHNGLSASLKCGLKHASEKYAGVLLLLVDLPLIQFRTFEQIFETGAGLLSKTTEPFAVQPGYQKQPGHPVLLGHFGQLNWQSLEGDVGAKPLIRHINNHILLDSGDRGVVFDIDTPEDYQEAIKIEEVI